MAEKKKKPKSKIRQIIEWVLFGVFGVACLVVLGANVSGMINKKKNYGQQIRFGYGTFIILTDSMEPQININDLIITKKEDCSKFKQRLDNNEDIVMTFFDEPVNVGDFVPDTPAFKEVGHPSDPTYSPMTHKLREVHIDENKKVGEGHYIFVTSGINTMGLNSREGQYQVFTEVQYLGTVKSINPALGRFTSFISSVWGLLILLLIPAGYLIVVSSIDILKAVKTQEEEAAAPNSGEHLSKLSDKEREKLKQELLDEMLRQKKGDK